MQIKKKNLNYSKQNINAGDKKLVATSLKADLITTGNFVTTFEKKIKNYFNSNYALSCSSGTAALHIAFKSIDLKPGDAVIMPAINFISAFNLCKNIGAKIYLADVSPETGQMLPDNVLKCIEKNKIKKIKLILTMYLGGYPENVVEFYKIKKKYKSILIEDACHALGSKYKYKNKFYKIGSCKHSDISTFSLHPLKTITSGEGGVVTTNNKKIFQKMKLFRSHGIKRNKNKHWEYDVIENGFNYRISDINCALAISQLNRINSFLTSRKKIFNFYMKYLYQNNQSFLKIRYNKTNIPAYHLFLLKLNNILSKNNIKNKLINYMMKMGIKCQYHYIPIYRFKIFTTKIKYSDFKGSEKFYNSTFSIPIYVDLSRQDQKRIIKNLKNYFKK